MNVTVSALLPYVVALLGGGGLIAYLRFRPERDLGFAKTAELLTDTAAKLVEPLRAENMLLQARVGKLETQVAECVEVAAENVALRARVDKLEASIMERGDPLPNGPETSS